MNRTCNGMISNGGYAAMLPGKQKSISNKYTYLVNGKIFNTADEVREFTGITICNLRYHFNIDDSFEYDGYVISRDLL